MTLSPSQLAWANEQIGDKRAVAHTGVITKVAAKGANWVATVEDDLKMVSTVEMAGVTKATADSHIGVESTVLVDGTVGKVIDNNDGFVTFEVTGVNGKVYDRVLPPEMTDAEVTQAFPPPTPEEKAAVKEEAEFNQREQLSSIFLAMLNEDAEFKTAVRTALGV